MNLMWVPVALISWIVGSFLIVGIYIVACEISYHVNAIKKDRAEAKFQKRYLEVTEEFQHDFD